MDISFISDIINVCENGTVETAHTVMILYFNRTDLNSCTCATQFSERSKRIMVLYSVEFWDVSQRCGIEIRIDHTSRFNCTERALYSGETLFNSVKFSRTLKSSKENAVFKFFFGKLFTTFRRNS